MHKVFCSSITLRKEEPSTANIILHYWCVWRKKSPQNGHKWRKKISFSKTMLCVTSRLQLCQNYMNCHFELLPHPAYSPELVPCDYCCLQTSNNALKIFSSNEEVKLRRILRPKTNLSTKKGIKLLEKPWNQCITKEGDYVDELSRILPKTFFIS